MGDAVPVASEETDFLLQVISPPHRKVVEVFNGHPENAEEFLLREVPLSARDKHTVGGGVGGGG